uniref:OmpA-like domain-containing protein n=1 Tax=Tanacetum cinerariifolium TaxID=118510 RepID=A0A699GIJ5_TANCI|nr:hypothetical protein [Tanacetum cinerariifolium]
MTKPKPCVETSAIAHKAVIAREARRVTSYDVALVAGVSQSAVSRCFQQNASRAEPADRRPRQARAAVYAAARSGRRHGPGTVRGVAIPGGRRDCRRAPDGRPCRRIRPPPRAGRAVQPHPARGDCEHRHVRPPRGGPPAGLAPGRRRPPPLRHPGRRGQRRRRHRCRRAQARRLRASGRTGPARARGRVRPVRLRQRRGRPARRGCRHGRPRRRAGRHPLRQRHDGHRLPRLRAPRTGHRRPAPAVGGRLRRGGAGKLAQLQPHHAAPADGENGHGGRRPAVRSDRRPRRARRRRRAARVQRPVHRRRHRPAGADPGAGAGPAAGAGARTLARAGRYNVADERPLPVSRLQHPPLHAARPDAHRRAARHRPGAKQGRAGGRQRRRRQDHHAGAAHRRGAGAQAGARAHPGPHVYARSARRDAPAPAGRGRAGRAGRPRGRHDVRRLCRAPARRHRRRRPAHLQRAAPAQGPGAGRHRPGRRAVCGTTGQPGAAHPRDCRQPVPGRAAEPQGHHGAGRRRRVPGRGRSGRAAGRAGGRLPDHAGLRGAAARRRRRRRAARPVRRHVRPGLQPRRRRAPGRTPARLPPGRVRRTARPERNGVPHSRRPDRPPTVLFRGHGRPRPGDLRPARRQRHVSEPALCRALSQAGALSAHVHVPPRPPPGLRHGPLQGQAGGIEPAAAHAHQPAPLPRRRPLRAAGGCRRAALEGRRPRARRLRHPDPRPPPVGGHRKRADRSGPRLPHARHGRLPAARRDPVLARHAGHCAARFRRRQVGTGAHGRGGRPDRVQRDGVFGPPHGPLQGPDPEIPRPAGRTVFNRGRAPRRRGAQLPRRCQPGHQARRNRRHRLAVHGGPGHAGRRRAHRAVRTGATGGHRAPHLRAAVRRGRGQQVGGRPAGVGGSVQPGPGRLLGRHECARSVHPPQARPQGRADRMRGQRQGQGIRPRDPAVSAGRRVSPSAAAAPRRGQPVLPGARRHGSGRGHSAQPGPGGRGGGGRCGAGASLPDGQLPREGCGQGAGRPVRHGAPRLPHTLVCFPHNIIRIGSISMKAKTNILLAACTVALLSACSTPAPAPAPAPEPVQAAPAPAPAPAPVAAPVQAPLAAYLDPNSSIYKNRSVYFDFDKYTVKPEFDALVADHGKFLAANPNVSIKVEGNTDDRGSAEYNLALGQKRAQALITALKVQGVKDSQLEAISYGKEKPKATGSDEESRAQNRRDDIIYPSK